MIVRPARPDDATQIAYIYNHYIATSHVTFELDPIDGDEILQRMEEVWDRGYPFLVYNEGGGIFGYAYGHAFRPRAAYARSIETSVYVKPGHDGMGVGTALYNDLISEIQAGEFHSIIAGISLPNESSIHLHEKFGFKKVAHFAEVGRKFGRWIDVGYWQLLLSK